MWFSGQTDKAEARPSMIMRAIDNLRFDRELNFLLKRAPVTNNPYGVTERMQSLTDMSYGKPGQRLRAISAGVTIAETLAERTDGGPAAQLFRGLAVSIAGDATLGEILIEKGPALAAKIRFKPSAELVTDTVGLLQRYRPSTATAPTL